MGQLKKGGSGCYCGENSLLASLLAHLLIARDEVVILDMSAGIEHLSRGTARSVDKLIVVVEPGRASIETAHRIRKLASEIGIVNLAIVGNKIHNRQEERYIKESLKDSNILGFIPYDSALVTTELASQSVLDASPAVTMAVDAVYRRLAVGKNPVGIGLGH